MLVTSTFSFSHNVFKNFLLKGRVWERINFIMFTHIDLINPVPNKPWVLCVCSTSLLKTLWEKEKLVVTSNFSFSHSVSTLLENILHFPSKPWVLCVCSTSLLKTPWEKEKLLAMSNFFFSHGALYSFR